MSMDSPWTSKTVDPQQATYDFDESIDDALASIDIPSPPKISKVQTTVSSSGDSLAASSSTPSTSKGVTDEPKVITPANSHCILVHPNQKGNSILKSIQNCPYEFRDIVPDYVVGKSTCILYLSLKYHNLNPEYICNRLKDLGKQYTLRVLLVQIDVQNPHNGLKTLTRISLLSDLTLMLAWNDEEAGKVIETYKLFENRPPDLIMERVEGNPQQVVTALTSIKPVNKSDAVSLFQNFGTLENIIIASENRLSLVTGMGPRKAKKLHKTLNEPFMSL